MDIKEHTFCGEQTKKAINCDCGIFYFKDDVEQALKEVQEEKEIKKIKSKEKIIRFCSRCGKEWCVLGKITEYGKHYPAFKVKNISGEFVEYPADDEIKEALCRECAKEVYDKKLTNK